MYELTWLNHITCPASLVQGVEKQDQLSMTILSCNLEVLLPWNDARTIIGTFLRREPVKWNMRTQRNFQKLCNHKERMNNTFPLQRFRLGSDSGLDKAYMSVYALYQQYMLCQTTVSFLFFYTCSIEETKCWDESILSHAMRFSSVSKQVLFPGTVWNTPSWKTKNS